MSPEEISRLLDELEARLGPPAEHAFSLAMRQVGVDIVIGSLVVLVLGSLTIGLTLFVVYSLRRRREERYSDWDLGAVFGTLGAILFGMILMVALGYLLTAILNPEWVALQKLLGAIR